MKVFIPEPNRRFDMRRANSFGDLTYMCHQLDPLNVDETIASLQEALDREQFDPDTDFLLMTGDQYIIALTLALMANRYRQVKTLMFNAKTAHYVEKVVYFAKQVA